MAATEVSICSNALLMLGGQPINDLSENSDRARLASNLWPAVRNYVLRRHPWNCAVKRVALAPDLTPPAFDWAFQFTLPPDFMRVLAVGEAGARPTSKLRAASCCATRTRRCCGTCGATRTGHLGRHARVGNDRLDEGGDGVPHHAVRVARAGGRGRAEGRAAAGAGRGRTGRAA